MTLVLAMSAPNAICMAVDYRDKGALGSTQRRSPPGGPPRYWVAWHCDHPCHQDHPGRPLHHTKGPRETSPPAARVLHTNPGRPGSPSILGSPGSSTNPINHQPLPATIPSQQRSARPSHTALSIRSAMRPCTAPPHQPRGDYARRHGGVGRPPGTPRRRCRPQRQVGRRSGCGAELGDRRGGATTANAAALTNRRPCWSAPATTSPSPMRSADSSTTNATSAARNRPRKPARSTPAGKLGRPRKDASR